MNNGTTVVASDALVEFRNVEKSFGATKALRSIDLLIEPGKIHALVGENGAGKSTALGVLAGRVSPSAGTVSLRGKEIAYGSPKALRDAGISSVYQELTIAPLLSVEANLFLGRPISRAGLLREKWMRRRYVELCAQIGVEPKPPGTLAGRLSVADQQLLEIMRVLLDDCTVVLLDEPTASLAEHERETVFRLLRGFRDRGMAVVIVSHNLEEVLKLSDTITVFREGQRVRSDATSAWSKAALVEAMLGDAAPRLRGELLGALADPDSQSNPAPEVVRVRVPCPDVHREDALLRVKGLSVRGAITDVDFSIWPGEIVGIAGLVGSGRSTVLRALYGLEPSASGRLWINGKETPLPRSVRKARSNGIALLPEDRKEQGLVLTMSAMDNIVLSDLAGARKLGQLTTQSVRSAAASVSGRVKFNESRLSTLAQNLSGGNQQKLLVARWLYAEPSVFLADEPSRGVDIGARSEILKVLEEAAATGMGVVMVSSELEELAAVCHRVVVLNGGRVVGELRAPLAVSEMLHMAFDNERKAEEDND